jgi:hypothetical protein
VGGGMGWGTLKRVEEFGSREGGMEKIWFLRFG